MQTVEEYYSKYKDELPEGFQFQLSDVDASLISRYAAEVKTPNCYVEVGTFHGGSALVARDSASPDVKVYTIDITDNYKLKHRNDIEFINMSSLKAAAIWDKPIETLFIDAHHDMAGIDFGAWERHLVKGGHILFHDCGSLLRTSSPLVYRDCQIIANTMSDIYQVVYAPKIEDPTSICVIKKL
jgi:predicted O-methyltransferase YrrM